nr:LptF/LptG family permease [Desulfurispira natronophila]
MQYLNVVLVTALVLVSLYSVIDIIGNLDDIVQLKPRQILNFAGATALVGLYHLTPAVLLIATVLFIGTLSMSNELKIMLSAGISLKKISLPLLAISFAITLGHFALGEDVFQRIQPAMDNLQLEAQGESRPSAIIAGKLWVRNHDGTRFVQIERYQTNLNKLTGVEIFEVDTNKITTFIKASYGHLQPDEIKLYDIVKRDFASMDSQRHQAYSLNFPGIQKAVMASVKPIEEYSFRELHHDISILQKTGHSTAIYISEMLSRVSYSMAILILTFVAIPLGISGERKSGKVFAVTTGLLVALVYYIIDSLATTLGRAEAVSPYIAPFIANGVFLGICAFLLARQRSIL